MKKGLIYSMLMGMLLPLAGFSIAAETAQTRDQYQLQERDMYGWELMTPNERAEYRKKMQNMHTQGERDQYRIEHHEQMQERARERGVDLHDMPQGGHGSGMGSGMGGGMGGGKR